MTKIKPTIHSTYTQAGVDTEKEEKALRLFFKWIQKSFSFRNNIGVPLLNRKYFANVIDIGGSVGLALSTDGVGTKIMIAQMMNKYDTIGIDCVAMNVNDIICVGAEPICMLDYLAVEKIDNHLMEEIAKGLYQGAKIARITIPGGETAQIREMIKGAVGSVGFDLAGLTVGLVPLNQIIIGQNITEGDVIIGFRSSGIHSNGLTLARKIFFNDAGVSIGKYFDELGRTIGEELLEPTHIYVPEIMEVIKSGVRVKALINITSDGFLNLKRVKKTKIGYIISDFPEPQPIFSLIQKFGNVSDEEMYKVFNMGIGFCVIVPNNEIESVKQIARKHNVDAYEIGYTVADPEEKVVIEPKGLIGKGDQFYKMRQNSCKVK
ncbi:TPA: phosphoribosylformylglycinamidine cyclo-ligase [Candidatus Poribacteria bacterium]|nr:phosphoribosylformylglycinamidine cyclo-ligase [Candidatus Poribacteria bacterium]